MGIGFSIESIRSEDRLVKIKGILILIALILFAMGGFLDSTSTTFFLNFIDRIILVASVIIFYFGFIMPDWLKVKISEKDKI